MFNLISHQPGIDKIYLYAKDLYEAKYQLLINKIENKRLKHLNDFKAFIEYSDDMKNTIQRNNAKHWLFLIIWLLIHLVIKKLSLTLTELFITGRKLIISLVFIRQSYLALHAFLHFIMKIPNKHELQQIAFNHSSDVDVKDFMNLYKKCTAKLYCPLVVDTIFASDNHSDFRKSLLERIKNNHDNSWSDWR